METVFAGAIALLTLSALLNLFPLTSVGLHHTNRKLHARQIAGSQLEQARAQPFGYFVVDTTTPATQVTFDDTTYDWRLHTYAVPGESSNYLKGLVVIVGWTENNKRCEITEESYVANLTR